MNNGTTLKVPSAGLLLDGPKGDFAFFLIPCLRLLLMAVLATGSYLFFSQNVFQSVRVVGASMSPTLNHSDHCFLNRWVYKLRSPARSDIVVIKDPTDGAFAVKRIIAGPGESVHFKDGQIYVNGAKLAEPYLRFGTPTYIETDVQEALVLCGKDQYFVLGDNRADSYDSRSYGPVKRQNILGAVLH
jgi:signal peptidase I